MGIYTKKGDRGETSLYGGTRLSKNALRVWCYGTVDEADSILGTIYASLQFDDLKQIVRTMQRKMFIIGAQLASDEKGLEMLQVKIVKEDIKELEHVIDSLTSEYGSFSGFTIPGETISSALFHVGRTVVRRAERLCVALSEEEFVCAYLIRYLNRLSDCLYVLARAEIYKCFIKKVVERIGELGMSSTNDSNLSMNYDLFEKMAEAVRLESEKLNVPVCFSIADKNGALCYFRKLDGAILPSISISQNKAYTAAVMRMSTQELDPLARPDGALFGINVGDPRLVVFGGGQVLTKDGNIVGAIGISGGSVEEDIQIGNKAIAVFDKN